MADGDDPNVDRPAATQPSNPPGQQKRPAGSNNESIPTSTHSRALSKSPQQGLLLSSESAVKSSLRESQPMTASSSSSSLPSDQQMDTTGTSPYGTRSRNRTGNARPNYAEDRDIDMEYEWTNGRRVQAVSGSAVPQGSQLGDMEKVSTGSTRRSSILASNGVVTSNSSPIPNPQNTNLPGMSTFSAYPDPNAVSAQPAPTRKRKAPGSGPVASHSSSVPAQASSAGMSRRTAPSPQAGRLKMTNLMTFEGCQCYLKNGKLKADDGTVLAVNGKTSIHII